MGRRIFKKVYNGETLEKHLSFVYDGYKLIEERNALDNDAAVRKYVWQPEALDRDVPLTVYDAASEKTYYYHTDANKNVTELSDESGSVVAHYEYSPFGSLTKVTGDYAGSNPFRFSSEYYDEETELIYYNYRYYNPELGRWISRDPIEEQGGYNLYGMIENNPFMFWDYLGLQEHECWNSADARKALRGNPVFNDSKAFWGYAGEMLAAGFGALWDFASMISSNWAAVGIVGDNITNSNVPSKVSEAAEIVTDIAKSGNLPSPVSVSFVSDTVKEIITTTFKSQSQEADNEQRTRDIKNYNKKVLKGL